VWEQEARKNNLIIFSLHEKMEEDNEHTQMIRQIGERKIGHTGCPGTHTQHYKARKQYRNQTYICKV
jgi:hypothetical protein